ncbi:probable serine/threonine-protein kinase At1g54610 isoform X2 [Humulus lupulus]|uniref:probable serine/threonine-protein kinase At1g54610 isoform X2 n=1 Tax=Humulus lupulus TaxID=3486 RepID=UPI002B408F2D|nr:probable serine/threonine-protein kinase At1g54610 isoform X2 [Humulus lupulus]
MGCIQAKSLTQSSPGGLEKLKMENGFVGKGGIVGSRRSTGQTYPERELGTKQHRARPGIISDELSSSNDSGHEDGRSIGSEEKGERNGGNVSKRISIEDEELADGWPQWLLDNVPKEVLVGLVPKTAESYDKLAKVGQGTYSNVYKARDRDTGKIVALKKVRFETSEPESVKFMAREITILRKLDHQHVLKLEGLATSRMQYSLYLVFEFMQSDLLRIISRPEKLTEPQIKCYMHQLLSGLQHCHSRGILHRDIKGSNLLIDRNGMLKIGDLGLANNYSQNRKRPLTNRVVTLWYRAPELLLGATDYGTGIDLWSAGCLLAEMFTGEPIMPGRTEVEQIHMIFKLCGAPTEEYWKKLKLPSSFRPPQLYKSRLAEAFSHIPTSSLGLLKTLLSLDPTSRGSAALALQHEFFSTSPLACDLSGLPVIHNDDDNVDQAIDEKKTRNSKVRRSRTHRERRRRGLTSEKPEDPAVPKEVKVEEKTAELNTRTEDPFSTTTTSSSSSGAYLLGQKETSSTTTTNSSSTSSSAYLPGQKESLLFSPSPVRPSNLKTSASSQRLSDANQTDKNLPPLPKPKIRITNYSKDSKIHRSISTREFRNLNQREHLKRYVVDD